MLYWDTTQKPFHCFDGHLEGYEISCSTIPKVHLLTSGGMLEKSVGQTKIDTSILEHNSDFLIARSSEVKAV